MDDAYVSVDDAATALQVSRTMLWNWIRRLKLPTFRFVGDRRTSVRRADVAPPRRPIPGGRGAKLGALEPSRAATDTGAR